jgi:NAD kinase
MFKADQKIVIVTRETRLQGLRARFATKSQAAFYVKRAVEAEMAREADARGQDLDLGAARGAAEAEFARYEEEEAVYGAAVDRLRRDLGDLGPKVQVVDRSFVPNFVFGPNDVVVTVGQDGLVANTAKYAVGLAIVGCNPDPARIDGVLLPFEVGGTRSAVRRALDDKARVRLVTLAEALLPTGQRMLAFNDFFVGAESHVSARYRIKFAGRSEPQSSSGVIVSTGAGSTGWLSSLFNMAAGLAGMAAGPPASAAGAPPAAASPPPAPARAPVRMQWEDPRLTFVVREPFVSKHSSAGIVAGMIEPPEELIIESHMPNGGVIFSDGIEQDALAFNSGVIARIRAAKERARLVVP